MPFTIVTRVVVTALAVLGVTYLVAGIHVDSFATALVVSVVLGVLHLVVRPVLLLVALPITLLTLGLFTLVINGLLFYSAQFFVSGFTVDTFFAGFLGALIVSAASTVVYKIIA